MAKNNNAVSARALRNEKARRANAGNKKKKKDTSDQGVSKAISGAASTVKKNVVDRPNMYVNKPKQKQSAVQKRAGISDQDYNRVKTNTNKVKNLTKSNLQQIVASHARTLGVASENTTLEARTAAAHIVQNKASKDVQNAKKAGEKSKTTKNPLSDWASKQLEKSTKEIEKQKAGMGKAGQFAADVYGAGLGLATDAMAGPFAMVSMFSRSFGSAYDTAEKEGASKGQAMLYGASIGGVETATEKLFAVAKPLQKIYGKGVADDLSERVLNKMVGKHSGTGKGDLIYNGGKTFAAALTEGLEEMIAEGLEPTLANQIYANALGMHKETDPGQVLYAGAVGGALGGILGGGGQVVEYNQGAQVREMYGEEGISDMLKKAVESDDINDAVKATAMKAMVDNGKGIVAGQAGQLKKAVDAQNKRDIERLQISDRSARNIMADSKFIDIMQKIDEEGALELREHTRGVYDATKAKAIEVMDANGDIQLPGESVDQITSAIASVRTGAVTDIDTVNMFTMNNPEARAVYETVTGETLPKTNAETREYLYLKIAENRVNSAEAETNYFVGRVRGVLNQDISQTYDAKGQEAFAQIIDGLNPANVMAVERSIKTFEDYYEAGRRDETYEFMNSLDNPEYDILPEETRRAAYDAGVMDRNGAVSKAKDRALQLGQKAAENRSQLKTGGQRGKVTSKLSKENRSRFTAQQQIMFRKLAQVFNINIEITDEMDGNGTYSDGTITLSVNADRYLAYVFAHEITHHMELYAPEEYLKLKDLVRTSWDKNSLNGAIDAKIRHYANHGVTLTREGALDEILADSTYEMLQDEKFVDELCLEDRGMARAILDALKALIKKIRAVLVDGNRFTLAQNEALLSQLDILKDAEKLWIDGLMKAAENSDAVGVVDVQVKPFEITKDAVVDNVFEVASMDPVAVMNGDEFKKGEKDLIAQVDEYFTSLGNSEHNEVIGDVIFNRNTIGDDMGHGIGRNKAITFTAIPDVIREGRIIDAQYNWKDRGYDTVVLAAPVTIADSDYFMGLIIRRKPTAKDGLNSPTEQTHYVHEVIMQKISTDFKTGRAIKLGTGVNTDSIHNILQMLVDVKNGEINRADVENEIRTHEGKFSLKDSQFDIIQSTNPMLDDYHTGIRSVDDILTFEEALQDSDYEGWQNDGFDPDYTGEMAQEALDTGRITVYSSYPIENGVFVTPSRMEAESYSGIGEVHEQEVALEDVAWIDPTQGQYAKVKTVEEDSTTIHEDISYSFKDDENIIDEEKALTYNNINDLENDLKERWTAYETDEESRRIAAEAIRDLSESKYSLSDSRRTVAGVREVVADGLSREFINKGFVDFRGRQVNAAKDLAELMQVHRDPRFETFRIVYMKGNKIVGTEAISAQMPGFVPVFTQEEGGFYNRFKYMKERMSRLKADGYYLLHNHPSGIPEPSGPDIRVSEVYATEVPGYKGHVILDHDTYGSVEFNNNDTAGMVHQLENQMSIDFLKTATVNHPILGTSIEGSSDVANVCKAVENNDYVSSLIFIDSKGKVTGVENVSNAIMNNDAELAGYLRNAARYYGARAVAMGTHDPLIAAKSEVHIEKQSLLDCIWFYGNGDTSGWESMRAQMPGYVIPNMAFGKDEDEYGGKRVNEDNFNDNYNYHDGINISEDDVNDYVNGHPEDFPDSIPYWEYEHDAARVKDQTIGELRSQVARMKLDKLLTHGRVLDTSSVKEEVNSLVRMLMTSAEGTTAKTNLKLVDQITENVQGIYRTLKAGNEEDAIIDAYNLAEDIVENLQLVNDEMFYTYKELRDYLRTTKVYISEEDKSNIPDFKDFRRRNMGRLLIVNEGNSGISVDNMYMELCEMYPGMFDTELTHPADQLQEIADVRESLEPYDIALNDEETIQLIKETAHDLIEIAANGKPWVSWADRQREAYEGKVEALKQKHKEAIRDIKRKEKDRYDAKLAAQEAKADERVQKVKKKGEEKLQAEKDKNKQQRQNQREARQKKELIRKMEKNIQWLSDRLLKPTDDKHLPEGYQRAIAQLLYAIDTQTTRSKQLEEKYGFSQKKLKLLALKEEYKKIAENSDSGIILDEEIENNLTELGTLLDDYTISDASAEQVEMIYKVLRNIVHGIQHINKAFNERLKENYDELANETIFVAEHKKKRHDRSGLLGGLDTLLNESMVTPRDFFMRIGGGLNKTFLQIRKGMDDHVDNLTVTRDFFSELFEPYRKKTQIRKRNKPGSIVEDWRDSSTNEEFELESGGTIKLNVAQRMSLYCLMKRDQAVGHIMGSGIVASEVDAKSKIKQWAGAKKEVNSITSRVTWPDVEKIIGSLTQEQVEMADKLMGFLNNECAAWGNKASMRLFGYEKFTEENYFPIQSADVYLDSKFEGRTSVERIRNFGFTKGTVTNANNPIVIDDIFSVVADHVNKMSMYSAFAVPIADFTRVYNYKTRNEDGTLDKSVQAVLANAFGERVDRYVNNFMADLQSNTQMRAEGFTRLMDKTLANYKKATIGMNIRVALQQPTAIMRTFIMLDPKYFLNGNVNVAKNLKDMKDHCQIARWKSWGHNQVDMARDIDEIMMNREFTRFDYLSMGIYGSLDNVTWSVIWAAVRKEVQAKHPHVVVDSEEFYELCNDRASEIYDRTQVVDSVLHRSQVMRNTDTMSKILTSFMAEPTRTFNMIRSEFAAALDMARDGDKARASRKVAKAATIYLMNAFACAAAAAVADALRGKDLDDDDEPEKWFEHTLKNFITNANPLNLLPVAKEISSIWNGWGTQNMALEGMASFIESAKAAMEKANGNNDDTWETVLMDLGEGFGLLFGIPIKNMRRDIKALAGLLGIEVSASSEVEVQTEEKDKFLDKLFFNRMNIENGSGFDNFLNGIGFNRTDAEQAEYERERTVKALNKQTKNMSDKERADHVWSEVMSGYTKDLEAGNVKAVIERRKTLEAAGGDVDKFDKNVLGEAKAAFKKTIGDPDKAKASAQLRDYLKTEFGYTDAKISNELLTKTETAKEFQLALCTNDEATAISTLYDLVEAGLTYEDYCALYLGRASAIQGSDYSTGEFNAPVTGTVTSTFGYRNAPTAGASTYHQGIDIAAPEGTVVGAADGGKVSSVGYSKKKGNYVTIYHGNGRYTEYLHLWGYNVQKGDAVLPGQEIGKVGSTGVSTGPHLHFAVRESGTYVDPAGYIGL